MIVAFTGHRPNKLGGYKTPNPMSDFISTKIRDTLKTLNPTKVISGMALGTDQWAATIAWLLGIPFVAAVPFEGQETAWPEESQKFYRRLRERASEVVIVSSGGYSAKAMQVRNEWMVDNCDILIAVWDGTKGGTYNCVKYAESKGKTIVRINPNELEKSKADKAADAGTGAGPTPDGVRTGQAECRPIQSRDTESSPGNNSLG